MILRTYGCADCNYVMTVELRADQWDQPAPECPRCASDPMGQEFSPPAIGGSPQRRAADLALDIAEKDYGVADIQGQKEGPPKVRYRDVTQQQGGSSWGATTEMLQTAIALGRENRVRHGSGLELLQTSLRNGTQVDLIEASKKRSMRVW
jgi:hypothetical protein